MTKKLNESQLQKVVKNILDEVRGSLYRNVSPADAMRLFNQLAPMGRNRRLTYHDNLNAEKWINNNVQSWKTTDQAHKAIIDYLVKNYFGVPMDYI